MAKLYMFSTVAADQTVEVAVKTKETKETKEGNGHSNRGYSGYLHSFTDDLNDNKDICSFRILNFPKRHAL